MDKLEYYVWVEVELDKSYVQRVNFMEYVVRLMNILLDIEEGRWSIRDISIPSTVG